MDFKDIKPYLTIENFFYYAIGIVFVLLLASYGLSTVFNLFLEPQGYYEDSVLVLPFLGEIDILNIPVIPDVMAVLLMILLSGPPMLAIILMILLIPFWVLYLYVRDEKETLVVGGLSLAIFTGLAIFNLIFPERTRPETLLISVPIHLSFAVILSYLSTLLYHFRTKRD